MATLFPALTQEDAVSHGLGYVRARRFAYQIVSDTFSHAQDIPQRLLAIDRLLDLPNRLATLLQIEDIAYIVERELTGFHGEESIRAILAADVAQVETYLNAAFQALSRIWSDAVTDHLDLAGSAEFGDDCPDAERLAAFMDTLLVLRPHIEAEIWLTEISAPQPVHALWRMHNVWSLYLIGWCYQSREKIKERAESLLGFSQFDVLSNSPWFQAFDELLLSGKILMPFRLGANSGDRPLSDGLIVPIVGPIATGVMDESARLRLTNRFMTFARNAATSLPGRLGVQRTTVSEEELQDAAHRVESSPAADSDLRAWGVSIAWQLLHGISAEGAVGEAFFHAVGRSEWERLAALVAWVARQVREKEGTLSCFGAALAASPVDGLHLSFTNSEFALQVRQRSALDSRSDSTTDFHLTLLRSDACSDKVAETLEFLGAVKRQHPLVDLPSVVLHRARERQETAWSTHIFAVNQLLQRQTEPPVSANHRQGFTESQITGGSVKRARFGDASWLLLGYGSELCQHLLGISRADTVTIYWMDYSQEPSRLRHVAGYARHFVYRRRRDEIVAIFDQNTFGSDLEGESGLSTHRDRSLVYRVAKKNAVELIEGFHSEAAPAVWDGYPEEHRPHSALAIPIRYKNRVIGVLGLNGMVPGQMGKRLIEPLRRAVGLLGPFMHGSLVAQEIAHLLRLADTIPATKWRLPTTRSESPLPNIARTLCNVLLSPMAQVWMSGSDSNSYSLVATSHPHLFVDGGEPEFYVGERDVVPGFGERAILSWREVESAVRAKMEGQSESHAKELELRKWDSARSDPRFGSVVQGIYDPKRASSLASSGVNSSGSDFGVVGDDYVSGAGKSTAFRQKIFHTMQMKRAMAFALPRQTTIIASDSDGKPGPCELVGVVVMYDDYVGTESRSGDAPGYGPEWRSDVIYLQEVIPSILQQVKLIESEMETAHVLVIHEAARELNQFSARVRAFMGKSNYIFRGEGRNQMRTLLQFPEQTTPEKAHRLVETLFKNVQEAESAFQLLEAQKAPDFIQLIAARIEGVSAYSFLNVRPGESRRVFNAIDDLIERSKAKRKFIGGMPVEASVVVKASGKLDIWTVPGLWANLVGNLIANMMKYGEPDTPAVTVDGNIVRFENIGRYDAAKDANAARHLTFGYRGGAAVDGKPGTGYGLFIAGKAAQLAGIKMSYRIEPMGQAPTRAKYIVELDVRAVRP